MDAGLAHTLNATAEKVRQTPQFGNFKAINSLGCLLRAYSQKGSHFWKSSGSRKAQEQFSNYFFALAVKYADAGALFPVEDKAVFCSWKFSGSASKAEPGVKGIYAIRGVFGSDRKNYLAEPLYAADPHVNARHNPENGMILIVADSPYCWPAATTDGVVLDRQMTNLLVHEEGHKEWAGQAGKTSRIAFMHRLALGSYDLFSATHDANELHSYACCFLNDYAYSRFIHDNFIYNHMDELQDQKPSGKKNSRLPDSYRTKLRVVNALARFVNSKQAISELKDSYGILGFADGLRKIWPYDARQKAKDLISAPFDVYLACQFLEFMGIDGADAWAGELGKVSDEVRQAGLRYLALLDKYL